MQINPIYNFGDIVFCKTDVEHSPGMVVGYVITPKEFLYTVSFNGSSKDFYSFEISSDKHFN